MGENKILLLLIILLLFGNRKERGMQEIQNSMVTNHPQRVRKSIGRTAYEVTLHFSSTSKENPYDKLKRIILNDCTMLKKTRMKKNVEKSGFQKASPDV